MGSWLTAPLGASLYAPAAGLGPRVHSRPRAAPTLFGLHQDLGYFGLPAETYWDPRLNAAQSIEAQVTRSTVLWSVVEPSNDSWSWTRYDALIDNIATRGLAQIQILGYPPAWAAGSEGWVVPTGSGYSTFVNEFAEFCGEVAGRYAGYNVMWEIWNEPNEVYFWTPRALSVTDYGTMFSTCRTAMLAADSGAKVGLGGITGLGASGGLQGIDFISDLCDNGVAFDYAGIHPYVSDLDRGPNTHVDFEQNFDDIEAVHDMLVTKGRSNVKLWCSEWGWYGSTPVDSTKAQWLYDAQVRIRDEWGSFVEASTYFMDMDVGSYPTAGVFDSSLQRKALANAFEAFQAGQGWP